MQSTISCTISQCGELTAAPLSSKSESRNLRFVYNSLTAVLTLKPSFLIIQRLDSDDSEDSDSEQPVSQPAAAVDAPAPAIEASPPRDPEPQTHTSSPPEPAAQGVTGGKKGKRRAFKSSTEEPSDEQGSDVAPIASPDPMIVASEAVVEMEPIPIALPEEQATPSTDAIEDELEVSTVREHRNMTRHADDVQGGTVGKKKGKRRAFKSATKDD